MALGGWASTSSRDPKMVSHKDERNVAMWQPTRVVNASARTPDVTPLIVLHALPETVANIWL